MTVAKEEAPANYVPAAAVIRRAVSYTHLAGRTSTSGKPAGTGVWNPWPASPGGLTAIPVSYTHLKIFLTFHYEFML